MIKHRGRGISPAQLELILSQCPIISDVAVVGIPWEDTEVPRALVVLRPSIEPTRDVAKEIASDFENKVPDHHRLRGGVKFVDEIPRLVSGKICRAKLQQ